MAYCIFRNTGRNFRVGVANIGTLESELTEGEFATYSFRGVEEGNTVTLDLVCREAAAITVRQDGAERAVASLSPSSDLCRVSAAHTPSAASSIEVKVDEGLIELHAIAVE